MQSLSFISPRTRFITGLFGAAMLGLAGHASAQCVTTCPPGGITQSDGCIDDPADVNGGCNVSTVSPPLDDYGTLLDGVPASYCGSVGTAGTNSRDLDWVKFTLSGPARVTLSSTHNVVATNLPATNFTMFVFPIDCAAAAIFAAASGTCPFSTGELILPAGEYIAVFTVNAFAPNAPACPVNYVGTISAIYDIPGECGTGGDCITETLAGGCSDIECCATVCTSFPSCCDTSWDATCIELAVELCGFFVYECETIPGQPANDCFADALEVNTPSTAIFDSTNANTDGPDQPECGSGIDDPIWKDLWYYWEATGTGSLVASTCGLTEFDTKIAIYDLGSTLPADLLSEDLPGTFVICNEDCAGDPFFASTAEAAVEAGNIYLVRVGGFQEAGGPGEISFAFAGFPAADVCTELGTDPLTQSNSQAPLASNVACAGGGLTTANQFARSFNLGVGPTAGSDYKLTCVEFGIRNTGDPLVGTINIYADTNGGAPTSPTTDLALIASRQYTHLAGTPAIPTLATITTAFDPPLCIPAGTVLVVEIDIPASPNGSARIAGNTAGTTGVTFFRSAPCGINDYIDPATINFPLTNWAMLIRGSIDCVDAPSCPFDQAGAGENGDQPDGVVDGADLGALLSAWGACGAICPWDLAGGGENGDQPDGSVDGADLGALLAVWGVCPE